MILYTNKVLIYRRLYFLFTFFCGKIYLVVQNNINELKLKKLQRATKNILKRIQLFWEWTGLFSFFFFVYSYLDKVGEKPSDDNLILVKIQTFIFSTYNYFNICPKTINFNLVYFFHLKECKLFGDSFDPGNLWGSSCCMNLFTDLLCTQCRKSHAIMHMDTP